MRLANPELERKIRSVCLAALLEKEPEEISMRDIAARCGVSATTIYYYYADRDALFEAVKLECIAGMDDYIAERVAACGLSGLARLRAGLGAFRDWAFANPRVAILVMGRLKPNVTASRDELARYYRSNEFARAMLESAVSEGSVSCRDARLSSALCIAALWGAVEACLLNRVDPEYWERGTAFTDGMIDMCLAGLAAEGEKNNG
jgi:AcrR family transcriptional regulator